MSAKHFVPQHLNTNCIVFLTYRTHQLLQKHLILERLQVGTEGLGEKGKAENQVENNIQGIKEKPPPLLPDTCYYLLGEKELEQNDEA